MEKMKSGLHAGKVQAGVTRRDFITSTGYGAGALAMAGPLSLSTPAFAADGAIKVGFVSPLTGPLAGFGETDPYILAKDI